MRTAPSTWTRAPSGTMTFTSPIRPQAVTVTPSGSKLAEDRSTLASPIRVPTDTLGPTATQPPISTSPSRPNWDDGAGCRALGWGGTRDGMGSPAATRSSSSLVPAS